MAIAFSWSGGKDSTMALHELIERGEAPGILLTSVTEEYDRVSIHGVRRELLKEQARAIGIKLDEVFLSKDSSEDDYEAVMRSKLSSLRQGGTTAIGFGDIFLEWLKEKRMALAASVGMECVFPLWGRNTAELANAFIRLGYKAVITCVDSEALEKGFAGREFNSALLSDLPDRVDPCGENGEFHTFVYDGPIFKSKILISKGEVVLRKGRFYYCDLIPQ